MTTSLDGIDSSTDLLDLRAASRDLWPGGTLDHWQGRLAPLPSRVFWPRDADEVARVLRAAVEAAAPLVTYGAGSGVCAGARGPAGSWVLDTKRLDHILGLDEERWTVRVQAGVNGQHLEDWLQRRGFTLGHSPSSIWCSTVGGWAAARSAGQFSSKYGVFEDMVLSLQAVSPGIGCFRVGEGGEAPDAWMELLLGSEGTLAVITEVTLRVWPVPEQRWLRGYRCATVQDAVEAQRRLMQASLWPSVLRLYDPVDTRIGGKTKPRSEHGGQKGWWGRWLEQALAAPATRERLMSLPLALPGLVNRIADGLSSGCLLVVGWEGDPSVVEAQVAAGRVILDELGEDLGAEPGERWFHSRHAVSYKLAPIFEAGGFADTMEVACRWSQLVPTYQAVREALSDTVVVMAHMSHAYPEGGSIYFSFAGRGEREVYDRTWQAALDAVLEAGATVTHHHGVGRLKAPAVREEIGPAIGGWTALRARLDPTGTLNPGAVYGEGEASRAPPEVVLQPMDGLVEVPVTAGRASLEQARVAGEPRFPWERWPAPPRWQRCHWQVGVMGVRAVLAEESVSLGRGPRSASGPDLRRWVMENGEQVRVTVPRDDGERWLGRARVEEPWRLARSLLRADLRPCRLEVEDGWLYVGFSGPAAAALGALASSQIEGGLAPVAWTPFALPAGPLQPCSLDAPDVVAVTPQGAFRRVDE